MCVVPTLQERVLVFFGDRLVCEFLFENMQSGAVHDHLTIHHSSCKTTGGESRSNFEIKCPS